MFIYIVESPIRLEKKQHLNIWKVFLSFLFDRLAHPVNAILEKINSIINKNIGMVSYEDCFSILIEID